MERIVLLFAGLGVLGILAYDVLKTALGEGGGPITNRIAHGLRRVMRARGGRHRRVESIGILVIGSVVFLWLLMLWTGWFLIFNGSENAVIAQGSGQPAFAVDRAVYVGYTMLTLGFGGFEGGSTVWKLLAAVSALSGFSLVTFSITYLMPVVQAATHKREVARRIWAMGENAAEIIERHWRHGKLSSLEQQLAALQSDISLLQQHHIAYPVLHFMRAGNREEAIAVRLATLDETLTTIVHGVADGDDAFDPALLQDSRRIISSFLDLLQATHFSKAEKVPAPPPLEALERAGIPTVDVGRFHRALDDERERRALLKGLVEGDGWHWSDVAGQHA